MAGKSDNKVVGRNDYLAAAEFLESREGGQRMHKKEPQSRALRGAGELYGNREYVAAYECFKPVYDKVVHDMQRVLARNAEFEANKLAKETQRPLAVCKKNVENMKKQAEQLVSQFDRLLKDLESKPLVRVHLKKGNTGGAPVLQPVEEAETTRLSSADETLVHSAPPAAPELMIGEHHYRKSAYAPPEIGTMYSVRDKAGQERVIRIVGKSPDGTQVQAEIMEGATPSKRPILLPVESLARQAAKGWCSLLVSTETKRESSLGMKPPTAVDVSANVTMRLDIQNFSRCAADIARANIKFDTQLIKDIADGPFRAGNYEQAFRTFEQIAVGFTSAVGNSRRAIADGRRTLTAEKGNLSGKEIQERTAAFTRSEQLIHTAEREFSTILEGLRMYLRTVADQNRADES